MPNNYPFDPPQIRFVTRIYHPNIDDAGRICLDILKKGDKGSWKPALNLRTTLLSLVQLLAHPNPDDPLDAQIAKEYQIDRPTFDKKALEFTFKFANEEAVMSNHQDQVRGMMGNLEDHIWYSVMFVQEDEATFEEKVELESKCMESKEEEVVEESKPKWTLSLSKKKSNTGSSQTSTQHSSQSTQSSLASASPFSRNKKQSKQDNTASPQVHESTTSSKACESAVPAKMHDSIAPSTSHEPVTDNAKSPEASVPQIKTPEAETEAHVDNENKEALIDTHSNNIEQQQQQQTERESLAEKPKDSGYANKAKATEEKVESSYFALDKDKGKAVKPEPKPIKEVQVNVPKQALSNDTQQQQQNMKKRHGNDIIVLSDDEDGRGVVHSLRLSKKLKRSTLSLSKQRK